MRNIKRFPSDFMFQLNKEEFEKLRNDLIFQNGTSSWGGTRMSARALTMEEMENVNGGLVLLVYWHPKRTRQNPKKA